MFIYQLPFIVVGWFSEKITHKIGKKITAYSCFLLGSLVLTLFFWLNDYLSILLIIFFSSLLVSLAWPAIKGAYVDYLIESPQFKSEIEGLNDFSTNMGQIIGPISAGLLADSMGIYNTFGFIGLINIALVLVVLSFTPKQIKI
jgi:predicted MFS family arabinose efflux permease